MKEENVSDIFSLSERGMEKLVAQFKSVTDAPSDGTQQLLMTIDAMYDWWLRHHPEEKTLVYGMSGVAIIVQVRASSLINTRLSGLFQEMVHGNMNKMSGSGIAYCTPFTRGVFASEADGQELESSDEKKNEVDALEVSQISDLSHLHIW